MSAPLLIAQISDLHIKGPGVLAYGQVDTAAALTRCVATLNAFRPRPGLVVISGDLADTPVAASRNAAVVSLPVATMTSVQVPPVRLRIYESSLRRPRPNEFRSARYGRESNLVAVAPR